MAAAIVVIGCAGGGGGGGLTGTTDGTTDGTTSGDLRVTIPTPTNFTRPPGRLSFGFLTGQGRALGDLTLVIDRYSVVDAFGEVREDLQTGGEYALGSYSFLTASMVIPMENQQPSRLFTSYTLDPTELIEDLGSGVRRIGCFGILQPGGGFTRNWPPAPIPMNARVFAGRSTLVTIFIDDSMFSTFQDPNAPAGDPCGGQIALFDEARFLELNQVSGGSPIQGFINDYVEFDISNIPAAKRPRLSAQSGGQVAGRLYVSGDNFAISQGGASGPFELLTQFSNEPILGTFREPTLDPGGLPTPGTFTLEQLDPTDLFNMRKIVALQGEWRHAETVVAGFSTWSMLAFPNSQDGAEQEVVLLKKDGSGNIVDLFYGFLDYGTDVMRLFPVKGIVTGDVTGEVVAKITAQKNANGGNTNSVQDTRTATFNVTTPGALPADAPRDGTLLVFRI